MNRLLAMLVVIAAAIVARADVWTDPQTGIQWTYTPLSDDEVSLGDGCEAAISTDTAGELTLPSAVDGLTVTRISSCAFAGCDKLTAVTISDSVVSAESDSFEDCTSLWKVTIPYRFAKRSDEKSSHLKIRQFVLEIKYDDLV